MPEIRCNNKKVEDILCDVVKRYPNITKPIIAYVGNDQEEFENFLFEAGYGKRPHLNVSEDECASCFDTDKAHVLFINKKTYFKRYRPKWKLIAMCAHELAHMELSYDVDIEIPLNRVLIEKAELSKSDPIKYLQLDSDFDLSYNEYLTDVLAIGRGFARPLFMSRYFKDKSSSYLNATEMVSLLCSKKRLPYKIRSKGETPNVSGFCVTYYCCGEIRDGKPHGVVKKVLFNGNVLICCREDSIPFKGVYIKKNGNIYCGGFNERGGEGYGTYYLSDGSLYAGYWKYGKRNGDGTLYGPDGRIKTRSKWVNSLSIFPETTDSDECVKKELKGSVYRGSIKDGLFHGLGKLSFSNGEMFVGEFENDHYSHGAYLFNNGDIYYGNFKDGKRGGSGAYYFKKGQVCIGEWKDDRRTGDGKIYGWGGSILKDGWEDRLQLFPRKTKVKTEPRAQKSSKEYMRGLLSFRLSDLHYHRSSASKQ